MYTKRVGLGTRYPMGCPTVGSDARLSPPWEFTNNASDLYNRMLGDSQLPPTRLGNFPVYQKTQHPRRSALQVVTIVHPYLDSSERTNVDRYRCSNVQQEISSFDRTKRFHGGGRSFSTTKSVHSFASVWEYFVCPANPRPLSAISPRALLLVTIVDPFEISTVEGEACTDR